MKKISKKQRIIIAISIALLLIILAIILISNIIINKSKLKSEGYFATTANVSSTLVASYIKKGITIGGITGTLEILDTSDADATPEDISWGKTGYVNGEKITGTRIDTVSQGKEAKIYFDSNTRLIDSLNNNVVIPKGFKIAEDSATKVEDGIVIEDKDGNQFVWIPAKTGAGVTIHTEAKGDVTIVYKRTAYSSNVATGETDTGTNSEKINLSSSTNYYFTELLPTDEATSVNANGGYYIGRYEAGDKESTETKKMRISKSLQTNTITIKKDQVPYNYIETANAKRIAEEMSSVQEYRARTKLVSSYAWDTAISLMQIINADYGNSSAEGNYKDTSFTYKDISTVTDEEKTKSNGSSTLVPTGQTTAVCNIYDMGGNLWEYTTESYSYVSNAYASRGGCYDDYYADFSAGYRSYGYGNAYISIGFRITLFL